MLKLLEEFLHRYENSSVVQRYRLTRDEFLFLYLCANGHDFFEAMDYLDCQKSSLYRLRQQTIKKFKAKTFMEVMYLFGKNKE